MASRSVFFLVLFAILISTSATGAEVPRLITFQGRLTDDVGIPVPDDSYSVDFSIYDDSTSGSQLWVENHMVETVGGLFNVQLGLHSSLEESIFMDHTDLFIAMQLSGHPEMIPRTRLTSSAFSYQAFHAVHADVAVAATVGGGWRDDGNVVRLDTASDSVGIGTNTPAAKLEVSGDAIIRGKTTFGTDQTNSANGATITGGNGSIASGDYAVISGGESNLADSALATVGGGQGNIASGLGTTVGGGGANQAFARFSTIAGGGPSDLSDVLNTNNKAYDQFGTIGGGSGNKVGTNDGNRENNTHATVAGGYDNWAASIGSSVGGGRENFVEGDYATVAGGGGPTPSDGNWATGDWSAIGGGVANLAPGLSATVSGGSTNWAKGGSSTIGGGAANKADSAYTTVGGGAVNSAMADCATVSGGSHNDAIAQYATVSGGDRNTASGEGATIGGGSNNQVAAEWSSVGGGQYCYARANHSVVAGGGGFAESDSNSAQGSWSVISGGGKNLAEGHGSVIGGGAGNQSPGQYSAITGGTHNIAAADGSAVGGGKFNHSWGDYSAVSGGGGFYDYDSNSAKGECATIPGGRSNVADGDFSFAAGFRAKALHEGTFVWADHSHPYSDFQSTGANKFLIRASGGVGIGTVSPGAMLDVADDDRALRLRAGNGQAEFTDNQILLSYGGSVNYSHAIKSRHSGSTDARNAIDFYVWDQSVDAVTDVGTKHVMTIDGDNNGEVGIGTTEPNYTLDVRGTIGNNTTTYHSDRRWKTDIRTISDALEKVSGLRGVDFKWRQDEYQEMNFPPGEHLGVIAQEVEMVLPQLVDTDDSGYKSVEYANLTALLIEAVKELKTENDELRSRITDLERKIGK